MAQDHDHPQDIVINADGSKEYRDSRVVTDDEVLTSAHSGSICVHEGATFEISRRGQHSGSLWLQPGSIVRIVGQHSGSLHVAADSIVEVVGNQSGSSHVERGGLVRVAPGGVLAGSLHVAGVIENRGTRGGSEHMAGGAIRDLDGGAVKPPTRMGDGGTVYRW